MKQPINLLTKPQSEEITSNEKGQAFLISGILHLILLVIVLFGPSVLPQSQLSKPIKVSPPKRLGFLALPKDYQQIKERQVPSVVPPPSRSVQEDKPKFNSKRLSTPYPNQTKKLVNKLNVPNPATQPLSSLRAPKTSMTTPNISPKIQVERKSSDSKKIVKIEKKSDKSDLKNLFAGLSLPGNMSSRSLEKVNEGGSFGKPLSDNDAIRSDFIRRQPNFSVKRPTIISETHGVNFNPWLSSIYFRVRDNWYSVIPQVYRTGMRGVVVIVFDVRSNGVLEELAVVKSSGRSPYDRAAISSLKLSEPFPSFPADFVGDYLTLQFTYFYNISS